MSELFQAMFTLKFIIFSVCSGSLKPGSDVSVESGTQPWLVQLGCMFWVSHGKKLIRVTLFLVYCRLDLRLLMLALHRQY